MIFDDIAEAARYKCLGPLFHKAFDYMAATNLASLPPGKHTIQGDDLFVIVMEYETKGATACVMESHRKYIDIQCMLRGEELIGVKSLHGNEATTPYDETKEAAFYNGNFDSSIRLGEGQFAVFFPNDLHMPGIQNGNPAKVFKAVFKVRVG